MKFDRHKAFPYPVLRPYSDDYVESEFQATVEINPGKHKVEIEIHYALSSEEILGLIQQDQAEFISIISCRDTYYQKTITTKQRSLLKELDDGELRGEVLIDSYVVAKADVMNFHADDLNPEFGIDGFTFKQGDVLAQEETQVFYIDRDYFKSVTSVFDLVKNESLSDSEWRVNFEDDHVQIQLSADSKERVDSARNVRENQIVLINSIYFATVMQAIQKLKENDSKVAYEDKKWARVMLAQAHNLGIDIENHDAYYIAEKLMQQPFSLMRNYIFKGTDQ